MNITNNCAKSEGCAIYADDDSSSAAIDEFLYRTGRAPELDQCPIRFPAYIQENVSSQDVLVSELKHLPEWFFDGLQIVSFLTDIYLVLQLAPADPVLNGFVCVSEHTQCPLCKTFHFTYLPSATSPLPMYNCFEKESE